MTRVLRRLPTGQATILQDIDHLHRTFGQVRQQDMLSDEAVAVVDPGVGAVEVVRGAAVVVEVAPGAAVVRDTPAPVVADTTQKII